MGGSIRFTIPGPPMGKGRDRISKDGNCFTPVKTLNYEDRVRDTCIKKCDMRQANYSGQVAVDITAYYPIPSSGTKMKEAGNRCSARPMKKPDLDNIAKIVMDALNHIAWQDVKQVVCMVLTKKYAEVPGVSVGIHYLE